MHSLPARPLLIVAGMQLLAAAAGLTAATMLLRAAAGIGWRGLVTAFACYGVIATFVVVDLGRHAPHQHFGAANSVTLTRAGLTALLWGVVGETAFSWRDLGSDLRWLLTLVATAALVLDGADGWIARRRGMASDFGADFDMEVDSLFALALALLVYGTGRCGLWVLVSGLLRYVFVLVGWIWSTFAAPLRPSQRRKLICAIQAAVLIAALAPSVPAEGAQALCLAGLALLSYSFAADILWLAKARAG
jgi:phosphatidylglycerophosphate synthase